MVGPREPIGIDQFLKDNPAVMNYVTSVVLIVLVSFAFFFWYGSVAGSKPSVHAMCRALGFLGMALSLSLAMVVVSPGLVSGLLQAVENTVTLVSAYNLMVFCLLTGNPGRQVSQRIRSRRRILHVALVVLIGCYVAGPLQNDLPAINGTYAEDSFVLAYQATFAAYLGLAMINVVWLSHQAEKANVPRFLLAGMRLLKVGAVVGLLYVLHRFAYSAAAAAGMQPPWQEYGPVGVATWLILAAVGSLMAGVLVPPLGARWDLRSATRAITPLWRDLIDAAPELRFEQAGVPSVRARVTEIRDVLLGPLRPYLDPEVSSRATERVSDVDHLTELDRRATVDAAVIAVAVRAKSNGLPPLTTTPADMTGHEQHGIDDAAWLARVGNAYTTSRIVREVTEEFVPA
jgi:hypothetical protein